MFGVEGISLTLRLPLSSPSHSLICSNYTDLVSSWDVDSPKWNWQGWIQVENVRELIWKRRERPDWPSGRLSHGWNFSYVEPSFPFFPFCSSLFWTKNNNVKLSMSTLTRNLIFLTSLSPQLSASSSTLSPLGKFIHVRRVEGNNNCGILFPVLFDSFSNWKILFLASIVC